MFAILKAVPGLIRRCWQNITHSRKNLYDFALPPRKPIQSLRSFRAVVLTQMERMLASETFVHSVKLSRLLRYIVEKSVQEQVDELKESIIAMEVFGRKPSFDGGIDAVVRVNACRLRGKLMEYYFQFGQRDPIIITIPKGHYVAIFEKAKWVDDSWAVGSVDAGRVPKPLAPIGQKPIG